ncbi:MAG: AraC family transcriptional regulator [Clostridia bacterium]|nr:AraC family transcriptional regulator [Clostridia bacterium]
MNLYSIPLTYLTGNAFCKPLGAYNDFSHLPRPLHSVAYIVSGCALFVCGKEQLRVCAGDVVYVAKGCRYHSLWEGDPETNFLSCHFDLVPFGEPIGNREYPLQVIKNCEALYEDFVTVVQKEHTPLSSLQALGRFLHILSTLFARMHFSYAPPINEQIRRAVRYIESHYDTPLRVPELAALCHMSPSYFHERFKAEMGTSPIEYKNRITIGHAQRILLDHPEVPIEQISEKLGFESAIYFRRLFKATTGKTPREYRKTVREGI